MSANNGDKARFGKRRKRKINRRESNRAVRAELSRKASTSREPGAGA